MSFTYMIENVIVLRSLNVEHIHLREVNEEDAETAVWNCCESDNPGKV
jgi:hypothetical protein